MRIPYTISKNVSETYRCSEHTLLLPNERNRTISPEDEKWDEHVVPELKCLALGVLVARWKENPILDSLPTCVDRDVVLESLPTDLPLELIIERIPDEIYWQRAAEARWDHNYPPDHGNSWRRLYCERHFAEYLEGLDATYFHAQREACEDLMKLLEEHVHVLRIATLIPTKYPFKWSGEGSEDQCTVEDYPVNHIPMNVILPKLSHLQEIYISFGLIYMNDGFEWRDFKFSVEDCSNLGRGIKDCPSLKKFSLTRSNLDETRVAALLQGAAVNSMLEELDFSHCKLGDKGAHAIGEFLTLHKGLKVLNLANNKIGPSGVSGIVYGLLQENATPLKHLNLRLNPLKDEGGVHICALILRHNLLEALNISGCELGTETGVGMAECIASGYLKFSHLELDISNNDLGPIAGEAFEVAMKTCVSIVGLDVRMCNFSKDAEFSMSEITARNKEERKKGASKTPRRSSMVLPVRDVSLQPPAIFAHLQKPRSPAHAVNSTSGSMQVHLIAEDSKSEIFEEGMEGRKKSADLFTPMSKSSAQISPDQTNKLSSNQLGIKSAANLAAKSSQMMRPGSLMNSRTNSQMEKLDEN